MGIRCAATGHVSLGGQPTQMLAQTAWPIPHHVATYMCNAHASLHVAAHACTVQNKKCAALNRWCEDEHRGFELAYPSLALHAVSRDGGVAGGAPCIYCQIYSGDHDDDDADTVELRLIPENSASRESVLCMRANIVRTSVCTSAGAVFHSPTSAITHPPACM
jgi:hypothetical protein